MESNLEVVPANAVLQSSGEDFEFSKNNKEWQVLTVETLCEFCGGTEQGSSMSGCL